MRSIKKNSVSLVKTLAELSLIKKSQAINEEIFQNLKKMLKIGMSEKEIALKIKDMALNKNSVTPHHKNTNKKLKKGDMILIDMGVKYKGYCSDMTRMIFTKNPTKEQKNIYNLVLEAQKTAIAKIKLGLKCSKLDKIARIIIKKAGFEKNFEHGLGHGVGLEIHQSPKISQKSKDVLKENDVITIEPGIYLPNKFGIRIEDMAIVTKNGCEIITKIPKLLEESIIRI